MIRKEGELRIGETIKVRIVRLKGHTYATAIVPENVEVIYVDTSD